MLVSPVTEVSDMLEDSGDAWECDCECVSFRLYEDGTIQCIKCGAEQSGVGAVPAVVQWDD